MLLEMLSVVANSSSRQSQYLTDLTFFLASLDTLEPPETSIK